MQDKKYQKIDFFLGGAPKSGTSTLQEVLCSHPDIVGPKIKETHYFSSLDASQSYYNVQIIKTANQLSKIYPSSNHGLFGDFSPSYLASDTAFHKIIEYNPSAKMIVILRDPVRRAISHYYMDISLGYAKKSVSLADYLANSPMHKYQYVRCGKYKRGVELGRELFGSNFLVLGYENYVEEPDFTLAQIMDFLGLRKNVQLQKAHSNPGVIDRFGILGIYNQSKLGKGFGRLLPKEFKSGIKRLVTSKGNPELDFDERKIATYFEEDYEYMRREYPLITRKWRGDED